MMQLAESADGLHPAEDFLDALSHALTDAITGVPRGASIDRAAARTLRVLRDMRCHIHASHLTHEVFGIVAFIGSKRDPLLPRNLFDHCDRGSRLGTTVSLGHLAMEGCVLRVAEELAFEAPSQPVDASFPLTFSADTNDE